MALLTGPLARFSLTSHWDCDWRGEPQEYIPHLPSGLTVTLAFGLLGEPLVACWPSKKRETRQR